MEAQALPIDDPRALVEQASGVQKYPTGGEMFGRVAEQLERDELHDMDWDHLDELTSGRTKTETQTLSNAQPAVGPIVSTREKLSFFYFLALNNAIV